MSITNKIKFYIFLFILLATAVQAKALSIRVVEGVPLGNYEAMVEDGLRLGNAELLRKAWTHYENAITFDSKNSPAATSYLELGKIYFYLSLLGCSTEEEYFKAESYAKKILESNPNESDAHRALGLIFAGHGSYMDAFEELSLALKLNPTNDLLVCDMASLHLALHQPDKTIEYLEKLKANKGWNQILLAMAYSQKHLNGRAYLAINRAEKLGYKGYWVDMMKESISKEIGLELNKK
jgi:tetratricopeptide (TPR) repeat protein